MIFIITELYYFVTNIWEDHCLSQGIINWAELYSHVTDFQEVQVFNGDNYHPSQARLLILDTRRITNEQTQHGCSAHPSQADLHQHNFSRNNVCEGLSIPHLSHLSESKVEDDLNITDRCLGYITLLELPWLKRSNSSTWEYSYVHDNTFEGVTWVFEMPQTKHEGSTTTFVTIDHSCHHFSQIRSQLSSIIAHKKHQQLDIAQRARSLTYKN